MAYNDIRSLNVNGEMTPIGHPYYVASTTGSATASTSIQFNLEVCNTSDVIGTGTLVVTGITSTGLHTQVTIPIKGASPVNNVAIENTSVGGVYCSGCTVKHSGTTKAAYSFTFSAAVAAYVSVFNSNVKVSSYNATSLTGTKTMQMKSDALIEGRDYGTAAQRDALTHRKGQIFYVAV